METQSEATAAAQFENHLMQKAYRYSRGSYSEMYV